MPIPLTCLGCKRTMKVKDEFAGKKARCPFCNDIVLVPEQEPPREREPEARSYGLADEPEDDRPARGRRDEPDEPRRRPTLHDVDDDVRAVQRKKASSGGGFNSSVGGGIAMMVIAVVWFFGALALGRIFFYPPILFVMGIIAFIRGLSGQEE